MVSVVYIVFILLEHKTNLKSHEKLCKNKDFWRIAVPSKKNKMLEFNQHMTSDIKPYIIYPDIES